MNLIEKKAIPSINSKMIDWCFAQDNSKVHVSKNKNPGNTIYDCFKETMLNILNCRQIHRISLDSKLNIPRPHQGKLLQ